MFHYLEDIKNLDIKNLDIERKKLYFRDDGFIILNKIVTDIDNSYIPERFYELFYKSLENYKLKSKNLLDFKLENFLLHNKNEKAIFCKILINGLNKKEYTNDFKIFDQYLLQLIKEYSKKQR